MKSITLIISALAGQAVMAVPTAKLAARDTCLIDTPSWGCTQHTHSGDSDYFCCDPFFAEDIEEDCGAECHLCHQLAPFHLWWRRTGRKAGMALPFPLSTEDIWPSRFHRLMAPIDAEDYGERSKEKDNEDKEID